MIKVIKRFEQLMRNLIIINNCMQSLQWYYKFHLQLQKRHFDTFWRKISLPAVKKSCGEAHLVLKDSAEFFKNDTPHQICATFCPRSWNSCPTGTEVPGGADQDRTSHRRRPRCWTDGIHLSEAVGKRGWFVFVLRRYDLDKDEEQFLQR